MRTREDGATIKEDFDDLIVVCVGSQDLAYSLLFLLLVLIDVDDVDNVDDDDKGRIPLPNRMNFWKSAKGGGSFSIQKFILQILRTLNRAFLS